MMVGTELPPTALFSALRTLHHQAGGFQAHPAQVLELSDAEEQEPCSGQAAALLHAPFQQKQPLPTSRLSAGDLGSHIRCLQRSVKAFKGTTKTPLKCPCLTKHPFRFKPVCLSFLSGLFTQNYLGLHSVCPTEKQNNIFKECSSLIKNYCTHTFTDF